MNADKVMNSGIIYRLKTIKVNEADETIGTEYPKMDTKYPINNIFVLPTIKVIRCEDKMKRKKKKRVTVFRICCCNCFLGGSDDNIEGEGETIELQYNN